MKKIFGIFILMNLLPILFLLCYILDPLSVPEKLIYSKLSAYTFGWIAQIIALIIVGIGYAGVVLIEDEKK